MCECLKRPDGTWHVDKCCAYVMDAHHDGRVEIAERAAIAVRCGKCGLDNPSLEHAFTCNPTLI